MCNANAITIGDIAQTKDSCAYVTFQYNGVGDLYVLNRVSKSNIPTGRVKWAVNYLSCPCCLKKFTVDDSFDGDWFRE